MYDPNSVLQAVDENLVPVMSLCGIALVGNYIYWIENLRTGFKNGVHSMPIGCLFFFLPHDVTFLAYFHKWFYEYGHWFPKLWWAGLCVTVLMEFIFLYMILRYARKEIMPEISQLVFSVTILGGLAAVGVAWLVVKSAMNDEFFLIIFGITIFWCGPFTFAMMTLRKSAVGQPISAWLGYTLMPICYWSALTLLDPYFRSPLWVSLGIVAFSFGAVNLLYIRRLTTNDLTFKSV